ncbi:hypothetical protein [Rhodovulum sulfidophilum]|uniref:hypothetical protein n=1 Tax=Rhodovulum sulfidophilum TaxID=35806 RepID=UPI00095300D4|nr:hypothetical protein [Rhodovulum sulfidophilum]MBL3551001.1 hypothetical protein [Rhodovulum sulfidophilum]OLS47034.1 hypothetical protein BV379_01180 [Rhodovulum sulfidophilum]
MSAALVLSVSACAKRPDAIAPAPIPAGMYDGMSCAKARKTLIDVNAEIQKLSRRQSGAATADAIGVFLTLVSAVTGGDRAGRIAAAKGRKLALEARLESCG